MSESVIFYLVVSFGVIGLLMLYKPFRGFILGLFGAKSVWALIWMIVAELFVAHWTVIRNFLPRGIIYPTLERGKHVNAEDQ